jgi:hypothetical protein
MSRAVLVACLTLTPWQEYDPTRLSTDVAGKLARCLVPDGAHLKKGEAFAEIEVGFGMQHRVICSCIIAAVDKSTRGLW